MKWRNYIFAILMVMAFMATSCEDLLEVPDISNNTVVIFAPVDGSVLSTNAVSFNWDAVGDASSYRFQLVQPNFENAQQIVVDSIIAADSLGNVATQIGQDLLNGNYTWRIRASNSGYETAYATSGFQVDGDENIDLTPPNTPQLVSPANGASQTEALVDFSWTREDISGSAERDSIFIYSDESLQSLTTKALGANKMYSANMASGTFYWFVRAYDSAGNESDASTTFNFTVDN